MGKKGNCSLYLVSEDGGDLAFDLGVDGIKLSTVKKFAAGDQWGFKDVCALPAAGDVTLSVEVRVPLPSFSGGVSWSLPAAGFSNYTKGGCLESPSFDTGGRHLRLLFYPSGATDAKKGNCSLYLVSE